MFILPKTSGALLMSGVKNLAATLTLSSRFTLGIVAPSAVSLDEDCFYYYS